MELEIRHADDCTISILVAQGESTEGVKCDCGAATQARLTARQIKGLCRVEGGTAGRAPSPHRIKFSMLLADWQSLKELAGE